MHGLSASPSACVTENGWISVLCSAPLAMSPVGNCILRYLLAQPLIFGSSVQCFKILCPHMLPPECNAPVAPTGWHLSALT
jgi:hypothetical protein